MPTGYTADIQNDITFQQFALNCACAFGACISLRDEPAGTQIQEVFEPDIKYYDKNIEKKIKRIKKMAYKDVDRLIKKEFNDYVMECAKSFIDSIYPSNTIPEIIEPFNSKVYQISIDMHEKEIKKLRKMSYDRLEILIQKEYDEKLEDHEQSQRNLLKRKEYLANMLKKIENWVPPTIEHQKLKGFMFEEIESKLKYVCDIMISDKPVKKTPKQYKQDTLKQLTNDLNFFKTQQKKEIEECKKQTEWVKQLRESLK